MDSNTGFYKDCMEYFDALRRQGKNDDGFEDEYYYTMPAMRASE